MRSKYLRILLTLGAALLAGLISPTVLALDPFKALSQYTHDHWDMTDGLPQDVILAIAQTPDGYLWLGTQEGLARFDGVRFRTFNRASTPELRTNWVKALCVAPDGALWIGTIDGLLRMHGSHFTAFGESNGLRLSHVLSLACAGDGTVWIGTRGGGLFHTHGETVRQADGWKDADTSVTAVLPLGGGAVLAGAFGDGLFRCTQGVCSPETVSPDVTDRRVTALYQDSTGTIWTGFLSGAVGRLRAGTWTAHSLARVTDQADSGLVRAITEDRAGSLWFGFLGGMLGRFAEPGIGNEAAFLPKESLRVLALFEDAEGGLWIGTDGGGLHRFKDARVTSVGHFEGLPAAITTAVFEDRDGTLWTGTMDEGLIAVRNGRVRTYSTAEGLPSNDVYSLAQDPQGRILAGTAKGVAVLIGNRFRALRKPGPKSEGQVVALFADSSGRVWVGGPQPGLAYLRELEQITLGPADGYGDGTAKNFAEGPDGRIWIGTGNRGLYIYDGSAFQQISIESGLAVASVQGIYVDASNVGWVATQGGGLHWIEHNRVTRVPTSGWLPTDHFYSVSEDGSGHLLLSSNKGILRVAKSDLRAAAAAGGTARAAYELIGKEDGMRSANCTGGTQPGVWKDRSGRHWFPTDKGLVGLDESNVRKNARAPAVLVESVAADGEAVDLAGPAEFGPEARRVDIAYTAPSLLAPSRVRFKYRLDGLDHDWVEAGDRRSTMFTGLRPGRYTFRVIAANNDGVWNMEGASFGFSIRAPFYRTPVFYAAIALAVGGLLLLLYRYREARLQARMARLEERNRISREFHDILAEGFTGIFVQLEVARKLLDTQRDEAGGHLGRAQKLAEHCLEEARQAVWTLRTRSDADAMPFAERLRELATRQLADTGIALTFQEDSEDVTLPPEKTHQVYRIVQEVVSNIVRHSKATHARIHMTGAGNSMTVQVQDDGCGFDAGSAAGNGFGLRGMRERAEQIGATLSVHSEPGGGTRVELTVPLLALRRLR